MLVFAAPEIEEVVIGRTNFRIAAKSAGRQTLRKQLDSGSRNSTVIKVIPKKSAKQISWLRRDFFTSISQKSCRVIFGTDLLWQFPEIFE